METLSFAGISWLLPSPRMVPQSPPQLTAKGQRSECSATGPSTAAGRNNKAPTSRMVPSSTNPNVIVSVRRVPAVNGVGFLAARLPAMAIGAMIGMKRLNSMTSPQAMSHCGLNGAGGDGLSSALLKP